MDKHYTQLLSGLLTTAVVTFAVLILHRFIPSLLWAGIITITTYPLYQRWRVFFGPYRNLSALLFTGMLTVLILAPVSWMISILVRELQVLVNYLLWTNQYGSEAPYVLQQIPGFGKEATAYWDTYLGHPGAIKLALSNLHVTLAPWSQLIRQVSINVMHRGVQMGFTLLILFFFYRDGDALTESIHCIGENYLGKRWSRYAHRLPLALRGTVNGTIFVGIGVGMVMAICYELVGVPGPTLLGFLTACAAMIPFVVPVVFLLIAAFLWCNGGLAGAIIVLVWGTVVMFVADHFIKPALIGGAIQLPFLAVLFGILGGVETLGLLGLFVGPIAMVLFVTLWNEAQEPIKNSPDTIGNLA
jgi:predicted PurR-regulated permease PerM